MFKNRRSAIKPLADEEMYLFHTDDKLNDQVRALKKLIEVNLHGCIAIGGQRGSGKTTFIRFCLRSYKDSHFPIFINISKSDLSLSTVLIRSLNNSKIFDILDEYQTALLHQLNELTYVTVNETYSYMKKDSVSEESNLKNQFNGDFDLKLNLSLLKLSSYKKLENTLNTKELELMEDKAQVDIKKFYDEEFLLSKLLELLEAISKKKIVFIIDELDKKDTSYIISLFNKYKELFLDSGAIFIFVMGSMSYFDIFSPGSRSIEGYSQYFLESYYLGSMSWLSFLSLCYRKLDMKYLEDVKILYIKSRGLYRLALVGHYKYSYTYKDSLELEKANLLIDLLEDKRIKEIPNLFLDFLIDCCTNFFEHIVVLKKAPFEYAKQHFMLHENNQLFQVYINIFLSILSEKCTGTTYFISFGYAGLSEKKYFLYEESPDRWEKAIDILHNKTHIDDVLKPDILTRSVYNTKIPPREVEFVRKLEYRNTKGFRKLIHILKASFNDVAGVITLEKEIKAFSSTDCAYSAIILVKEAGGSTAYYVEDCAWSYEGYTYWVEFQKNLETINLKEFGIRSKHVVINDSLIETKISEIVKKFYDDCVG
ncbi:P-loop NTPase fold protein [Paenibacillus contaminans]|uniref:P-loop NTPase fold protein n=1 Tax=Paenibacillus contaminans TaxID=450362 RepID=UPI00131469FF|nr:P-loop NTPase fold protein [Paenibacillus contaminans]